MSPKRLTSISSIFDSKDWLEKRRKKAKYISKEFQSFGLELASNLNDYKNKSLYIKIAKTEKRPFVERAYSFAIDYPKAKNKGKIFMWKLKDLKQEYNKKIKEEKDTQISLL